jgi:RNA polymerase sigma-70 factor (ECF subfamily)
MDYQDRRLHTRLKRYIGRLLKRPEDVEDVTQEAFLKVLEAGARGEIHYPKAYLYRTARNLALNSLTRKSTQLTDSLEDLLAPDVLTKSGLLEDDLVIQERFELFCRALVTLPELSRKVLVLRKFYGLSRKEVAAELEISVSSVEKHLAKALDSCIRYMEVCGYPSESKKQLRKER